MCSINVHFPSLPFHKQLTSLFADLVDRESSQVSDPVGLSWILVPSLTSSDLGNISKPHLPPKYDTGGAYSFMVGGESKEAVSGYSRQPHSPVPHLPLAEILDSLFMVHLALRRTPSPPQSREVRDVLSHLFQRCDSFPCQSLPLPAEVSNPPTEPLAQKGRKQSWSVILEACPGECYLVKNEGRDPMNKSCSNILPGKWGSVAWVQLA